IELIKEDLNVKEVALDKKIERKIELDLTITPELKEEGIVREIIRNLQEMRKEAEEILANARQIAEKIVSDAKQKSDELITQAKNQAREEADRIMNSARAQIEREKQAALDEVEKRAGEIAVALAMKILQGVLDEKAKKEYLINVLEKGQNR
ncbi:MAG: DUF5915 domain-containing protein, partial [Pseudothermotoga sp.]